jgi:hypothetical protein
MATLAYPPKERHHVNKECPRCGGSGRMIVFGFGPTPEENITAIIPCLECKTFETDLLSRVLGLPVIVVRGVLWLAGFLVLASIAYIIHFSWGVLL